MVQSEVYHPSDGIITQLNAVKDKEGLWRVETRIIMREDSEEFRYPILLPKGHQAVDRLIQQEHLRMGRSGIQKCSS